MKSNSTKRVSNGLFIFQNTFFRKFTALSGIAGLLLILGAMILYESHSGFAALHIDTSYSGRYRASPRYKAFLNDLPFVYQEAYQKIHRALGLPYIDNLKIVVIFSDHLTHNGHRLRGKKRSTEDRFGNKVHYIYLDLEFLMNGQATLLEMMAHEMTHAVMAEIMGLAKYDSLPMWVKEGTAVHAADQGLARIRALTRRGFDLVQILFEGEGSDGNPISLEEYVENYLKIQFLLKTYGSDKLHRFIKQVMQSGNVAKELAACFDGLSEDVMTKYAKDYIARTLLDNARPKHASEQMQRGIKFFEKGEFLSARLALTDALYGGLNESEFDRAAYLLAECFIQERNPQSAFEILKRIRPDTDAIPHDRFRFLNAYTQYAMGLISEAYLGFYSTFEISRDKAVQEGSLYYMIRILSEMGNPDEATRVLEVLKANFPESYYIPLATRIYRTAGF